MPGLCHTPAGTLGTYPRSTTVCGDTLILSQPARESGPSTWWALSRLPSLPSLACPSEGHPVNQGPRDGQISIQLEALSTGLSRCGSGSRRNGRGLGAWTAAWRGTCSGFLPAIHSRHRGSDSPFLIVKSSLLGKCTLNEMVSQPSAQQTLARDLAPSPLQQPQPFPTGLLRGRAGLLLLWAPRWGSVPARWAVSPCHGPWG